MLTLTIEGIDYFDETKQEFVAAEDLVIELEHSLVSLSKWEAIWEKPFLSSDEKTTEETLSYIMEMTLTPDIPPEAFSRITLSNLEDVNNYIKAKMSATYFRELPNKSRREVITSEILYYWMFTAGIPMECENWHLSRLLTLIKVFNEKNSPNKKKMSRSELAAQNRALNAQRRAKLGTTG